MLWGKAGTGKTRYCYAKSPDLYSVPDAELKWFDGYAGEEAILIDDYRGDAPISFILKLLDIYPLRLPVKGEFIPIRAKTIYITSNVCPQLWHSCSKEALLRRMHHIIEFNDTMTVDDIDAMIAAQNVDRFIGSQ